MVTFRPYYVVYRKKLPNTDDQSPCIYKVNSSWEMYLVEAGLETDIPHDTDLMPTPQPTEP